ncbi:MAG TPA: gallate dioxygenase [Rhizomicrobium sp.]
MARIIGGIGTSHVPTIAMAYDRKKQQEPAWAPMFEGYRPVAKWLAETKPDVLVTFFNDHASSFFFDLYPTFAVGIGEQFEVADEGGGKRPLPAIRGNLELSIHLAEQLVNEEFDIATFFDRPLDHGVFSQLPLLLPHEPAWPAALLPVSVNVVQYPLPTARRCHKLGQAVRRAIESFPQDLKVVIVGTGGLSHQVHGERAGFNSEAWDREFLELFVRAPERLLDMTHADFVRLGGAESVEIIMWLAMRGALPGPLRILHESYYLATSTAMAVGLYEQVEVAAEQRPRLVRA